MPDLSQILWGAGAFLILFALVIVAWFSIFRRVVVPTNEVHIVQRAKETVSYGSKLPAGNVYYKWPEFLPRIGLTTRVLPTSVFDLTLSDYDAYDQHRVPFVVDVVAFFRVSDSNMAAQRVASTDELYDQLEAIVQGAVRTTLAKHEIDEIMSERAKFGEYFTQEVTEQLQQWGVEAVKNIELMNVKDAKGSSVIHDIMAKRTSEIAKDSRIQVANNDRTAQLSEIAARQEVETRQAEAKQRIGQRQAEAEREVGLADENTRQAVAEQAAITAQRTMEVRRVEQTRQAEIDREVAVTEADEKRQTDVIRAEGTKQELAIRAEGIKVQTILEAEGQRDAALREAEGIRAVGEAKAAAEAALLQAPVTAQITLAKEIGGNEGYQNYLVTVRQIEAAEKIGVEQAAALEQAEIKIIAQTGDNPAGGLNSVMDLFSAKGGTALGATLEALAQSDRGKALLDKVSA